MKKRLKSQCAALPYRITHIGQEILLITSRESHRWIIPKGWAEPDLTPAQTAALEAYQEAGIKGTVNCDPCGTYTYEKRLKSGRTVACLVNVFLFRVDEELREWPEQAEREKRWFSLSEAAELVTEESLAALLKRLESHPQLATGLTASGTAVRPA